MIYTIIIIVLLVFVIGFLCVKLDKAGRENSYLMDELNTMEEQALKWKESAKSWEKLYTSKKRQ